MPALTRKFETAGWDTATHYHHAREGEVFPVACYDVMHKGDCVLPLVRTFDPPPPAPPREPAPEALEHTEQRERDIVI